MKSIDVYSVGTPPAFTLVPADDMYWTERANYELSYMFYLANTEGMEIRQEETSDYSTFISQWDTFSTSFVSWADDAIEASSDGLPVPSPPSVPALPGGGLLSFLLGVMVRYVIKAVIDWVFRKLKRETVGNEVAQVLKDALIFQEDSTDESILKRALLQEDEGVFISNLFLAWTQPIEVWLGTNGGIENISFVASSTP